MQFDWGLSIAGTIMVLICGFIPEAGGLISNDAGFISGAIFIAIGVKR